MKYKLHHTEQVAGSNGGLYDYQRRAVPGGWIYELFRSGQVDDTVVHTFVPDPSVEIEGEV